MKKIKIYTTRSCPYCHKAKALLDQKGLSYEEIDVTFSSELRAEMKKLAGGVNTVPQIFFDGDSMGGCNDLYSLEEQGKLDALLV